MSAIKGCIATEYCCHVQDIDIGVGEDMLLADVLLRIKSRQQRTTNKPGHSECDVTGQRICGLMANIPQFGTKTDQLCPDLDELFCICLHAMVYATVDIKDQRLSLPTVHEIKSIMKASPGLYGAEVTKKELTIKILAGAYKVALRQNLLVLLPSVNRQNMLLSLSAK